MAAALHEEGLASLARGDTKQAAASLERALEVEPTFLPALVDRLLPSPYEPSVLPRCVR
jgi:Tfp pilus assembly protein PilF